MKDELFKVQRPIVSNNPRPTLMVYNRDRSIMIHNHELAPELMTLFKDDYKIFVRAHVVTKGRRSVLVIDGVRYPDPGW